MKSLALLIINKKSFIKNISIEKRIVDFIKLDLSPVKKIIIGIEINIMLEIIFVL